MTTCSYDGGGPSSPELYPLRREGVSGDLVSSQRMASSTRGLFGKKSNLREMLFALCEYRKYLLRVAGERRLPTYAPFPER